MKRKINIDVTVTYTVSLSDVEVSEDVAQALVQCSHETIYDDEVDINKTKTIAMDWIVNNIHEQDCCDFEAQIDDLYVDGEPY